MSIRRIVRNPVYFSPAVIYAVLVAVLCFRAPLAHRDIFDQAGTRSETNLSTGIVPDQSQTASRQTSSAEPVELRADEVEIESQQQTNVIRAPLWELGSKFALNIPLFVAELGELLGFVVVIGLAYRFKSRLLNWAMAISRFIAARRRGTCIWLGFTIVLVLALFPPWIQISTYGGRYPTQRIKLWHARIDRAPIETTRWQSPEVDYARMLTEIATGECFVLALYLTWARIKLASGPKN